MLRDTLLIVCHPDTDFYGGQLLMPQLRNMNAKNF